VKAEAYIRKYHIAWFQMVIIIMSGRCCFEADLEVIRICHEWGTKFKIVRTKFDIDFRNFVYDHPEKIQKLTSEGKCNKKEISRCLRKETSEELAENLEKQGMKKEAVSKHVSQLFFR